MTQELRRLAEEEHEAMFYDRVSSGSKKYAELTKPAAILALLDRLEKAEKDAAELSETVQKALNRTYQLGQTYWQQADSEYTSQHRKADLTREKFDELKQEIRAAMEASK